MTNNKKGEGEKDDVATLTCYPDRKKGFTEKTKLLY